MLIRTPDAVQQAATATAIRPARRWRDATVALFFLLLTLLQTWPLATAPFTGTTPSNDVPSAARNS